MSGLYVMRPQQYIDGLKSLIEHINSISPTKEMEMVEIGSYAGESTEIFCKHFKNVLAIDPFIDNYDPNDLTCQHAPMDVVLQHFQDRMKETENVFLVRATSDDAIKHNLINGKVDFVYIDGMHTYEQVKKDIKNYLPIIKDGGFIGGHDYHPTYQGVIDAVNEMIGSPDYVSGDTSWIKKL